jgi:hypothetical protein
VRDVVLRAAVRGEPLQVATDQHRTTHARVLGVAEQAAGTPGQSFAWALNVHTQEWNQRDGRANGVGHLL